MEEVHCRGGHLVVRNPITGKMSSVPQHGGKAVKKGTLGAILKQLEISIEDFSNA
jgi:predicted RNA binding protein YcfA (HicA-like mRNA interferase family)